MVPEYLGAAAPGVGAMTMEEASIQAMPPIVIRRGCFMSSPFILRQSEWLFSPMVRSRARCPKARPVTVRCRAQPAGTKSGLFVRAYSHYIRNRNLARAWRRGAGGRAHGERARVAKCHGRRGEGPRVALLLAVRSRPLWNPLPW